MAAKSNKSKPHKPPAEQPAARIPHRPSTAELPADYPQLFDELKQRIRQERLRVVMAANAAMVLLYWDIGRAILDRQEQEGWGARVIDRLSADLRREFPDMQGLSPRNLKYMRAFAAAWPDRKIVQEVLARITWYHNIALLEKLSDPESRLWYARKTYEEGYVGQMNLYLSAVNDLLRHPDDKPTIGLLLCKGKDRLVVEYAPRDVQKPIGVAEWETRLVETLPEERQGILPTVEQLEAELAMFDKSSEVGDGE